MALRSPPVSGLITLLSIPATAALYWIAYHRGGIWMAAAGASFLVMLVGLLVQFGGRGGANAARQGMRGAEAPSEETSRAGAPSRIRGTPKKDSGAAPPAGGPRLPDWVPAAAGNPYPTVAPGAAARHDQEAFRRRVKAWLEGLGYSLADTDDARQGAIDVTGERQGERVAVAARDADLVGAREVRRFYDEVKRGGFLRGYLVTSGAFTDAARQFASLCPELHLVEGPALAETESAGDQPQTE